MSITVWIRAGGSEAKPQIAPFVSSVLSSLPGTGAHQIIICTNREDPVLEELDALTKTNLAVKVVFSTLNSFSTALTDLAKNTSSESVVLTLSLGVVIRPDQITLGLESLKGRVKVYGWRVHEHGNDGSAPGKWWYNTAALLHQAVVKQMKEKSVPSWVDNGVLGTIGPHTIGGNEEIPIMVEALKEDPEAQFILNVGDPVSLPNQTGTEVSFESKLARKLAVGEFYMQQLHAESGSDDFDAWKKNIADAVILT